MRNGWKASLGAFAIALFVASSVWASVPKMIWSEDFGATWCPYCPGARCGLDNMETEFSNQFYHAEVHVSNSDPFHTAECTARAARYGVSGIPHVVIDGKINEVGADVCNVMTGVYRDDINGRLGETGPVSPVKITGSMSVNGNLVTVSATYELVDPGSFTAHQATLFLFEDDVIWCCGYQGISEWDGLVRMVRSTPVSLTSVGQQVTVTQVYDVNTAVNVPVNLAKIHPAALFEEIGGQKAILQSSDLAPVDFSWNIGVEVASVPGGNGTATYEGTVTNIGETADVLSLTMDAGFGNWNAEFQIAGDPTWYSSHNLPLAPNETKGVTLRVQTNGTKEVRSGSLSVQSTNTGRVKPESARLFNGSYALLLVDDDNGTAYETDFTSALGTLGYLYDMTTNAGLASMLGYDAVVWQTGYQGAGNTLTTDDQASLMAYLDQGGKLFLSSMDFLGSLASPNTFTTSYLGIASWVNNTKAHTATGVSGDPITSGMVHNLTFPQESANRVDNLTPVASARAILLSEVGPNNPAAVRFEMPNGSRVVTSTIVEDAFSLAAPDPNNNRTFIDHVLQWILTPSANVIGGEVTANLSAMIGASPNPFAPATELQFRLSAAAAGSNAEILIVDASGRRVRALASGPMAAGLHSVTWDGADDLGHASPAGIYFARLKSKDGESALKLARTR